MLLFYNVVTNKCFKNTKNETKMYKNVRDVDKTVLRELDST